MLGLGSIFAAWNVAKKPGFDKILYKDTEIEEDHLNEPFEETDKEEEFREINLNETERILKKLVDNFQTKYKTETDRFMKKYALGNLKKYKSELKEI